MEVIASLIVGLCFGVLLMSLLHTNQENAYINIVKMLIDAVEHERICAIKEKKTADFINGISAVLALIKKYFKEELEDERLQKKN